MMMMRMMPRGDDGTRGFEWMGFPAVTATYFIRNNPHILPEYL